ncbi:MAG: hypothetical protein PHH48_08390 [Eubacteriales bacterium]|nr:hypothetical protein [Eubacteriales bacterium]
MIEKKPNHTPKSQKWQDRPCSLLPETGQIEHAKTNSRGSLKKRPLKGRSIIVVLGIKNELIIMPEDQVWTVFFSTEGAMSSIGIPDTDITLIL